MKKKIRGRPPGHKNSIYGIQSFKLIEILNKTFKPDAVIPIHNNLIKLLGIEKKVIDTTAGIIQDKQEQKPQIKVINFSEE